MDFTELIRAFGEKVGLAGLSPDDDGSCRVEIDGMAVSFMSHLETDSFVTWAEVGEPPPEGVTALYRVLMESMFIGQATGGSTFSIEPGTGKIFLHRVDSLRAIDLDSFWTTLEGFVNILERWRKLIADFRPVAAEAEKSPAEDIPALGSGFMQV